MDPTELEELRLSNAFSTIAVIEHEIVAVVTRRTPQVLEVVACSTTSAKEESPKDVPPVSQEKFGWQLTVTFNPRRPNRGKPSPIPTASDIKEPTIRDTGNDVDPELLDDHKLRTHVDEYW
jgi:hypothetical protein